jgi:WD40 repeat protein/energy-coupling factor transporter ATP-binding protein EcfA2
MLNQPLHSGEPQPHSFTHPDVPVGTENPFPGLRSFSIDECHLYFGREGQVDEILSQIAKTRFITIMGYSGSGKSSLMSCGLIPVLYGGFVTETGPFWNVITSRPGGAPIRAMVDSVVDFLIKNNSIPAEDRNIHWAIINSVLRSGSEGLLEIAKYLQSDKKENIFFLIDQFEEIFRFRDIADNDEQNEARLFVNLILTAVNQSKLPVYVAITMRSDFIGECAAFPGLTQLINNSNYLVPHMTRDQKRVAIEGPVAVAGGKISQRLVKRLLSDIGTSQDQLPVLQHALMRTWDYWVENHEPNEPIDIRHYNSIGKITQALSQHANEAYDELSARDKAIAEVLFKSITEKNQDNRGMRRPSSLALIAQLAEASEDEVIHVIEHFRKPGRSFLMPAAQVPLNGDSLIELSHESLMRIWNRLGTWVEDEFESASMYRRLSEAAAMYQIGKTGLWRPPDLQLALNWQKKQKPTREWAQRYDEAFERAIVFLDTSRITYEAELKNQEMMQRRVLRRTRATAIILGIAFIVAILFFVYAYLQKLQADSDRLYADTQRKQAQKSADEAFRQRANAVKQKSIAEKNADDLAQSLQALNNALDAAQRERDRAEAAFARAKIEEQKAVEAGVKEKEAAELAQLNADEAQLYLAIATSRYMLAIAQNLATKSVQEDDDKNLAGLQAMQGYIYHKRYKGKTYDPYIYRGLYSALTKLSGTNYNALKIPGPPRVHMRSLVISEKNTKFFTSGADGKIYEGEYIKGSSVATGFATPYPSKVIAMSSDERFLVNGSDSTTVHVYDLKAGGKRKVVNGFSGATNDIEFLPNRSEFIVVSAGNTISRVDAATGEMIILAILPFEIKTISISPDGNTVAGTTWTGQVVMLNLNTTDYTFLVDDPAFRMMVVRYSPDGKQLAYGLEVLDKQNRRGIVRLYDFATRETRQFTGHRAGINDIEFSADGKLLASAGLDKRLQLYVLENPEDLPVEMENNNGFVWDIAFANGSDLLIAACSESEIRIWPTNPATLADQICPQLTRNMTQDEWSKYVGSDNNYENTCTSLLIKEY